MTARLFGDETVRYPMKSLISSLMSTKSGRLSKLKKKGVIGKNVSISRGTVLNVEKVKIGNNVDIGPGVIINSKELTIGDNTSIGALCYIDCPKIIIGDHCKLREQVFVGGLTTSRSQLILGNHVTIYQFTVINTAEPVIIGNRVGIGGRCTLFTHGSWQNIFQGYPVRFGPITIEEDAWLPWEVFVMPGVTIGHGSTIGARSLITKDVPPLSLATGSPAKIIKQHPEYPLKLDKPAKFEILKKILTELKANATSNNWIFEQSEAGYGIQILMTSPSSKKISVYCIYNIEDLLDDILNHLTSNDALILFNDINVPISLKGDFSIFIIDGDKARINNPVGYELKELFKWYGVRFLYNL